jgi:hypothetical protein
LEVLSGACGNTPRTSAIVLPVFLRTALLFPDSSVFFWHFADSDSASNEDIFDSQRAEGLFLGNFEYLFKALFLPKRAKNRGCGITSIIQGFLRAGFRFTDTRRQHKFRRLFSV